MMKKSTGRLMTDNICQVGLVVRDIEKSVEAFSRIFRVSKPKISITDEPEKARAVYRGAPTQARAKLAFFDMGSLSLELIEPVGGPSTWQEFLDEHGEGVHHIAFRVKGTDEVVAFLHTLDMNVVQHGHYTGGMYTYVDSTPALGFILELLENFE
jgi:methylmalonyl-CoA/ethylmalonyl-CoA epimerase